jgi:hypothetical protein
MDQINQPAGFWIRLGALILGRYYYLLTSSLNRLFHNWSVKRSRDN